MLGNENVLLNFAQICENRSTQTGGHIKRVAEYMEVICDYLGVSDDERRCVVDASMMHDIGKIILDTKIIDKPGKLTDEEYDLVKEHTVAGRSMFEHTDDRVFMLARDIAYQHHERWDGLGYHHLEHDKVNPYAFYVAVVDTFDAMTSHRSYRDALSPSRARQEILKNRGSQFAPYAVDAFLSNYDKFVDILIRLSDEQIKEDTDMKLNYDRDVKPNVQKLTERYSKIKGKTIRVKEFGDKWQVIETKGSDETRLIDGTLRECYNYVLGMMNAFEI